MNTKDWLIQDLKEDWLEDRAVKAEKNNKIDKGFYKQYDIKQGLRMTMLYIFHALPFLTIEILEPKLSSIISI
jgi:hypothetical protein